MRLLPAAGHKRMPWKNGGGETTEIALWPEGAGLDDFDWRVSMATVASDGPFSRFPGIDRTLAVLRGAGVSLVVGGGAPAELTPASEPLCFPGEAATTATLLGGPILDLNVMTRRGRVAHRLTPLRLEADRDLSVRGSAVLLLCLAGAVRVVMAGGTPILQPFDALLSEVSTPSAWRLETEGPAGLMLIELRPTRAG